MKYLRRYRLGWRVLTPLHVGAGQTGVHEGEDASEVALITRDHAGKPWIPGSSLKGALGAACTSDKVRLFGKPHEKGSDQARGALTFSGARYVKKAGSDTSITIAQTSVASGTGVAAANKLYRREFVPECVEFVSEIDVETSSEMQLKADCASLELLLALASSPEGLQFGANKADDLGRLRITRIDCADSRFGPTGWTAQTFTSHTITATPPQQPPLLSLRMVCPGPFISKGGQKDNDTLPLMDAANKLPRIMGTAVSGALRKRAEWLWALHLHRGGPLEVKSCKTSAGPKDLDPVERLFGYEGRRGLLQVAPRNVKVGGTCQIPGVGLDAMTAAPRDKLLFFYHAHYGVTFDLLISARASLDATEGALFDLLKVDLEANGLKLGMGTTKGFGWFCIEQDPILRHYSERQTELLKPKSQADPKDIYLDAELPSNFVTIPYRLSRVDPNVIQLPETRVADRFKTHELLSLPMSSAASGHIDLVWHVETPILVAAQAHARTDPPTDVPFQKIGGTFAIPGSTIKGMLRAELERRVNARAYKIIANLLAITDDPAAETHISMRRSNSRPSRHICQKWVRTIPPISPKPSSASCANLRAPTRAATGMKPCT
ncbi:RAMP superfamily CRISPR-associated protein [Pseudotabrizicola sp. 4114]|uniref:RAMP superfamily CRISPR-associated protein n=1 Tax=Pseudotabrizicola sp. 4114 TaxID=2817731 RepID=UPI002865B984|nr:CRISPR/Cas system CSM-associated protein Csm3 (group 7 of RAMP superfamily) [Pseudorhodobacter sp. 4114]